jgi:MraZ protein
VFRGHFRHTIDPKGRLSIPSKFREGLREAGSDRLVIAPNGSSLDVYPEDKWRELEERVAALPKLDPDRRQYQHVYLSAGLDVVLDPHGRVQILQDYRERSGLAKNVVIIGMMDHFEIWDEDRWAIYQREHAGPLDDLRERLAAKGV